MGVSAVTTEGLTKRYGQVLAVDGVSFEIARGGVVGFVGPNGAGKSTTIRMLLGLMRPTSGSAHVLGVPIDHPQHHRGRIGALLEAPALYPQLSGRANLRVHATLGGFADERVDEVLALVGLADRAGDRAGGYSLGMQQRLAIAVALLGDPELLMLDEPTNGLDPQGTVEIRELLKDLGARGKTVLVSSHQLAEIQAACDRVLIIQGGRLMFDGSIDEALSRGRAGVAIAPERDADRQRLAEAVRAAGYDVADGADAGLHVVAPHHDAAALNRLAAEAGIVLRELRPHAGSLEEAFFTLTRDEQAPA